MPTLTGLLIWRRVCALGYFPLESYLSIHELVDNAIICVDPESADETVALAEAICRKYPKVRIVEFAWLKGLPNGTAIGIASNYALAQAKGDFVVNIQADEVWSPELTKKVKTLWPVLASSMGIEAFEFKVLHIEFNGQQFQGGGDWQHQRGSAYTHSTKLWRNCPSYRFSPDAWSIQAQGPDGKWDEGNVKLKSRIVESEKWPILHLHDFFADTVMERRRVQAEELWPTTPHYGATYHAMKDGQGQWAGLFNDPKWEQTTAPKQFMDLMPKNVVRHLGQSTYRIHWEDLQ